MFSYLTRFSTLLGLISSLLGSTVLAQAPDQNLQQQPASKTATSTLAKPTDLLAATIPEQQQAWLTINGNKELAYCLPTGGSKTHGGVLLLPGLGQHPLVNGTISSLRQQLADHDWYTLALDMKSSDPEKSLALIRSGIEYLKQQNLAYIVIAGEAMGAAQAVHFVASLSTNEAKKIDALVLINAHNSIASNVEGNLTTNQDDAEIDQNANSKINTLTELRELDLLTLDVYSQGGFQQQQRAQQRKRATRGASDNLFYQVRLPQTAAAKDGSANILLRRVRGWLDKHVAQQSNTL